MTLKRYANFEEKLSCGLKKNLRNLANFHQSTFLATQEVEVIVFPYATETEMKNGVASENKKMYLKINIFILTVFINQTYLAIQASVAIIQKQVYCSDLQSKSIGRFLYNVKTRLK